MKNLVRKNIENLVPYSSARNEILESGNILLDANELPYNEPLNRYPDPFQSKLKIKISEIKKVPANQLFLGNGSDECIDLVIRAFCEPKTDNILTIFPSYGMYEVQANINDVEIRKIDLLQNFQLDTKAILNNVDINSKLLMICNPNNPTANSFSKNDMKQILNEFKGLVIIDEAYIEFSNNKSYLNFLSEYEKLIIIQTFSKSHGLAGIRLGMLFGNPFIIETLNKVKYPYNINSLSINEAIKQLDSNNSNWIKIINEEKQKLIKTLNKLWIVEKVYESDTNFLLVKFKDAVVVYNKLKENGIVVRNRSSHKITRNCLRITVGNESQNKILIKNLKEIK
jgi:histidinol-phosphate aminotransferase